MGNGNRTKAKLDEKKEKNRLAQQRHREKLKSRIAYLEALVTQSSETLSQQVNDETPSSSTSSNINWTSGPIYNRSIKVEDDPGIELSNPPMTSFAQEAATTPSASKTLEDAWAMRSWGPDLDDQATEILCLSIPDTAVHQPEPCNTTTEPFESEAFSFEVPVLSVAEGVATPCNPTHNALPTSPASINLEQFSYTQGVDGKPRGPKSLDGTGDPVPDARRPFEMSARSETCISNELQEQLRSHVLRRNGFTLRIAELSMDGAQTVQLDQNEESAKQSTLTTLLEKILCA